MSQWMQHFVTAEPIPIQSQNESFADVLLLAVRFFPHDEVQIQPSNGLLVLLNRLEKFV